MIYRLTSLTLSTLRTKLVFILNGCTTSWTKHLTIDNSTEWWKNAEHTKIIKMKTWLSCCRPLTMKMTFLKLILFCRELTLFCREVNFVLAWVNFVLPWVNFVLPWVNCILPWVNCILPWVVFCREHLLLPWHLWATVYNSIKLFIVVVAISKNCPGDDKHVDVCKSWGFLGWYRGGYRNVYWLVKTNNSFLWWHMVRGVRGVRGHSPRKMLEIWSWKQYFLEFDGAYGPNAKVLNNFFLKTYFMI